MNAKRIKLFVVSFLLLALTSILLGACSRSGTVSSGESTTASNASSSESAVHMDATTFVQESITISKGSSLTLINDVMLPHIIQNGTWDNNEAKPAKESGAPEVQLNFTGPDTRSIGPFNTAGTFKLYCTVHPGMNLTVIVK